MSSYNFVPSCLRGQKITGSNPESGNMLFYILIGIVLIGFLTVALRDNGALDGSVDKESASVNATQIIKYSGEISQAVDTLLKNGVSENDIRFAYPSANAAYGSITTTPQYQVFSDQGAKAPYRKAPTGSVTTASDYGFSGDRSMPLAGSDKSDLTMSLGNLDDKTCKAINQQLGIPSIITVATCGTASFFNTSNLFSSSPIVIPSSAFTTLPALQACITCTDRAMNIYMSTLLAR